MPVPNNFANATTSIPLSQLDNNFATPITIGNTAVQLGNTVTTLNNMTLPNVTISSVATAFPNNFLANSTATLGNATITLGGTTTSVGNLTLTNGTYTNYTESVVAIGTVTTTNTLSLSNGTVQTATLTASTTCTFTMPTATAGKSFILLLKQAASTGNGNATFTSVKWGTAGAPTITAAAGKMDILTFVADGTNWYGSVAAGYTP
jgi:hypothetical protein